MSDHDFPDLGTPPPSDPPSPDVALAMERIRSATVRIRNGAWRSMGLPADDCYHLHLTRAELALVLLGLETRVCDYEGPVDVDAERELAQRIRAALPEGWR